MSGDPRGLQNRRDRALGQAGSIPVRLRQASPRLRCVAMSVDPRRLVPRTDAVLADPRLAGAGGRLGRALVKGAVAARSSGSGTASSPRPTRSHAVLAALPPRPAACGRCSTPPASSCTPTSAGRRCPAAAVEALVAAAGTTDVEFDLGTGRRGPARRGARSPRWPPRCRPPRPCTWSTTAPPRWCWPRPRWPPAGRSSSARGELVEIGDGFRMPDLLVEHRRPAARGGHDQPHHAGRLRAPRSGPQTGFVLKVHPSNFVVTRLHPRASPSRELAAASDAPGGRRHRLRAARAATRCCRTSRTPHRTLRGRRRPGDRQRRQAARRPAGRAAARPRRPGRAAAPAPAGPGAAGRQAHPGRAGGDAARAGAAGPGCWRPTPAPCASGPSGWPTGCATAGVDAPCVDAGARSAAAARPGRTLPSAAVACPRRTPGRCGRATPRSSAGSRAAAACSTCAACRRADDGRCRARSWGSRPDRHVTSSRPPGTSTTASRRWCGR